MRRLSIKPALRRLCIFMPILGLLGCSAVSETYQAQIGGLGGGTSHVANSIFQSKSKEMHVYRAAAAVAIFSAAGTQSISTQDDASDAIYAAVRSADQIRFMWQIARKIETDPECAHFVKICDEYFQNYERYTPRLDAVVYKSFTANIPNIEIDDVLKKIAVQNYLGAAIDIGEKVGGVLGPLNEASAALRSVRESFGVIVNRTMSAADEKFQPSFPHTVDQSVDITKKYYRDGGVFISGKGPLLPKVTEVDLAFLLEMVRKDCVILGRLAATDMKKMCEDIAMDCQKIEEKGDYKLRGCLANRR